MFFFLYCILFYNQVRFVYNKLFGINFIKKERIIYKNKYFSIILSINLFFIKNIEHISKFHFKKKLFEMKLRNLFENFILKQVVIYFQNQFKINHNE